jgi:predicted Zn finger-like uncharacterized protein
VYTQCPQCRTIYEISEDALQASLGIVRCGHCSERFDALLTLSESLPAEPDASLPEHDPDAIAPTLTSAVPPESIQASGEPRSRIAQGPTPAATASPPPGDGPAAAQPEDTWFDALSGERARALIADAAGLPPEAIQSDPAWQLTDLPVQARFAALDVIPVMDATPGSETAAWDPIEPASAANTEAAESEPFTEAWCLDIPDAALTEPMSVEEPATSNAEPRPIATGTPEEFADGEEDAFPPAAAETDVGPAARLPEDRFPADDELPPDTLDPEENGPAPTESQEEEPDDETKPAGTTEPVYVPPRRRRIRRSDWLWAAGCVVLALALAAQVAWASRAALVRDPATQAQALRVCTYIDCRLPPIRDTTKLELLSRDIRPDPDSTGALTITATFRNNAPYRQPWPVVVVELTDLDNSVVAMRRFRPAEYMPDTARRAAGVGAHSTAAVAFEVADPGRRAVSFHFGFE